jgi:lipopolysaccharide export system protein LptA
LLAALISGLLALSVNAETKEPINIEADNAKIIEKEGKSIYSGNVVLIQGTIRMTADTVTVQSSNGKLMQITAQGHPVTYYRQNQPASDDISGEANLLEYYATENRILLLDNARLSQGRTAFSGNRIEYNTVTDIVTAEVSKTGKERVQVIIQPDEISKISSPDTNKK